jgi:hypothetical protein
MAEVSIQFYLDASATPVFQRTKECFYKNALRKKMAGMSIDQRRSGWEASHVYGPIDEIPAERRRQGI